jgi:hypothetical protein
VDRNFYKRWHAHPVREALRQAALGNEYNIDGIDDVDDVQRRQLHVAGEYLREKAAADGPRTLGLRAAEADRLSALALGGDGFKLTDERDDPPIGEVADRVLRRARGW